MIDVIVVVVVVSCTRSGCKEVGPKWRRVFRLICCVTVDRRCLLGQGPLHNMTQTFCLLEQKVSQACQTCQTCRFRNLGVNQTQIPSLPSLPFLELVPIKHTLYSNFLPKPLTNLLAIQKTNLNPAIFLHSFNT